MIQGEYRWADTFEKVTYLPWSPGQPDNGAGEDCLGFNLDSDGRFRYHDYICTDRLGLICERE